MSAYLLDTNVVIHLLKQSNQYVVSRATPISMDALFYSSVTRGELIFGALKSANPGLANIQTNTFLETMNELTMDTSVANEYGRIRADLELRGMRIGSNDIMIAATAIVHNLVLVTHNTREFVRVPGLQIEDWELP